MVHTPESKGTLKAVVFLLSVGLLLASQSAAAETGRRGPNILLITVDTLRADRLGCYGYKHAQTPVIDALAKEGILFERAIAQVPLTWPSHVAIFTGTYPFHNGIQDFTGQPLAPEFRTVTQSLKDRGYATGAVVSAFVLDRSWGLDRGFDFYYDAFAGQDFLQKDLGLVDRRAEESVDQALSWLKGVRSGPFFFWLHLFDPHSPYDPPEPFRSAYRSQPYDGEVAYVDAQLGRLIDWLKKQGLYEDTLIAFLSDHGESLGEHGESEHGFFIYNATIWVPLIIKPHAQAGLEPRRIATPVETISVAPTLTRLAAAHDSIGKQFQAPSLMGLLSGGSGRRSADRPAYAETFYPFSSFGWSPLRSLQTDRYHYIEAPRPELYDLLADPGEKQNLASQEKARLASLREQLHSLVQRYQAPAPREHSSALSSETLEKLRSLGYVAYRAPLAASQLTSKLSDPKEKLWEYQTILKATDAFQAGDHSSGRSLLRKVQEADPELYLIPFLLGQSWSRQGNWREAAKEFDNCLQRNPTFDQAMMGLARALTMQGQFDRAQHWLERALELNPKNFRAWYELGRAQSRQKRSEARAAFREALSIQPNFAPALRDLGLLAMAEEDYRAAAENLEEAVTQGLRDPATYNYLGIAYSRTDRLHLAIDRYRRALALDPNFAEAHLNLAYAYQRLNQLEAAQREYETACRLEKEFCRYLPSPQPQGERPE